MQIVNDRIELNNEIMMGKPLEKSGCVIRINGSHHRMKHEDGRITTVLVHKNDPLPKGLFRKILREDLKISVEELKSYISSYL